MKEPWQQYFHVGVVHYMLFPECLGGDGPFLETLSTVCHDPFFEAVDVGPINDQKQREECAALLRDSRMIVSFACQPVQLREGLDLNAADAQQREQAVQTIVRHLDPARELGATRFAIMSGKNVPADQRRSALDRLIREVRRICQVARERAELPVVLEIFDHDMDKKALIGTCELAAHLAREVRRDFPDFGLLHDLSHIYLCHEDPARHLPLIREYLVAMHLGNSVSQRGHPQFGDLHPLFGISGGDSDVPQLRSFLKALFDIGFLRPGRRPVVGFEVRTPAGGSPLTTIANMKRTLQRAWWEW
jgi:sugar phosphate isomerase/epimerase